MTDREIIQGLINRDNRVTEDFFFVRCRPLFISIIGKVFDQEVEYNEIVNELYLYLLEEDAKRLREFEYRSSVYQWLKVVAIRFFIKKRRDNIEGSRRESFYSEGSMAPYGEKVDDIGRYQASDDIERLLAMMSNMRYFDVIRRLILEEVEPDELAAEMGVTVDNLYNIKRRAMSQLTRVALNDIRKYER